VLVSDCLLTLSAYVCMTICLRSGRGPSWAALYWGDNTH